MANNAWLLTGNKNIDPKTNFFGTTDKKPLIFKAGNTGAVKISADSGGGYYADQRRNQWFCRDESR